MDDVFLRKYCPISSHMQFVEMLSTVKIFVSPTIFLSWFQVAGYTSLTVPYSWQCKSRLRRENQIHCDGQSHVGPLGPYPQWKQCSAGPIRLAIWDLNSFKSRRYMHFSYTVSDASVFWYEIVFSMLPFHISADHKPNEKILTTTYLRSFRIFLKSGILFHNFSL